jgi:CRISPR-associated protein Cas2
MKQDLDNKNSCVYSLIIYDIQSDKLRLKFATLMEGYGYRVQKSAFEVYLPDSKFEKLLKLIPKFIDPNSDSVRVYKLRTDSKIYFFGQNIQINMDNLIIV